MGMHTPPPPLLTPVPRQTGGVLARNTGGGLASAPTTLSSAAGSTGAGMGPGMTGAGMTGGYAEPGSRAGSLFAGLGVVVAGGAIAAILLAGGGGNPSPSEAASTTPPPVTVDAGVELDAAPIDAAVEEPPIDAAPPPVDAAIDARKRRTPRGNTNGHSTRLGSSVDRGD
ncbi:MAG: hypothetical protein IPL61_22885 [Myxococcales bacterium]|nr:hypothetical protein [Myxococcales bacterium]